MTSRASEDLMDLLHAGLAKQMLSWIEEGELQPAQAAQIIKFLKDNDISGVAVTGPPLAALMGKLPELTFEDVQSHL